MRLIQVVVPALTPQEAAVIQQQLQDLVDKLGREKTLGLLENKDEVLGNPLVNMKLESYAKKHKQ